MYMTSTLYYKDSYIFSLPEPQDSQGRRQWNHETYPKKNSAAGLHTVSCLIPQRDIQPCNVTLHL